MEFSIDLASEAARQELLKEAESSEKNTKYVQKSGLYIATVNKMWLEKFSSGSEAIKFNFDTDGGEANNVSLFVTKKDGTPSFGMNMIRSGFMVCSGLTKLTPITIPTDDKTETIYKNAEGTRVGVVLQVIKRNGKGRNTDKVYSNYEIKTFFNPDNNLTGSEMLSGVTEAAKLATFIDGLEDIDETNNLNMTKDKGKQDFFKADSDDVPF